MTRFLIWLKGEKLWCAVCHRETPHLTEVDGWRRWTVCSETQGGEG